MNVGASHRRIEIGIRRLDIRTTLWAVANLKEYLAFYPSRVDASEVVS